MGIQDSLYIKDEIQDSNLNPRKMAGIQDSNLVFKDPMYGLSVKVAHVDMDVLFWFTAYSEIGR